jgi:hypothetical protein
VIFARSPRLSRLELAGRALTERTRELCAQNQIARWRYFRNFVGDFFAFFDGKNVSLKEGDELGFVKRDEFLSVMDFLYNF